MRKEIRNPTTLLAKVKDALMKVMSVYREDEDHRIFKQM
jgi:hypothetical protein